VADQRGAAFAARAVLLGLFAAGVWAFAESQKLRVAWVFLVPATLSLFAELPAWPARLIGAAEAAFRVIVLLGFGFGLAWTVYPVLPEVVFDLGPRVLGLALAGCAAAFFLSGASLPAGRGVVPASLGLLVVGMLTPVGHAPLLPAGLATLALALHAVLDAPAVLPRGVTSGLAGRLAQSSALLVAGALIAFGLVRLLPWAQPIVERASAGWIDSGAGPTRSAVGGDSATLGQLERVALSRRVVMRVHAQQPQKLRVRVLTRFDGRTWHAARSESRRLAPLPVAAFPDVPGSLLGLPGATADETRTAEVFRSRIVLALAAGALAAPRGTRFVQLAGSASVDTDGLVAASEPAVEIYGLINRRGVRDDVIPDRTALLALPADTDPRLLALAARLAEGAPQPLRVQRTLNHLDRECRYALDVGSFQGTQPVAEFLFEKKRGYCEYFASAAALLLRLQGIPTRYVTGWNVTQDDAAAGHFVVREGDAHAWIEAYLDDTGWVELDPTPAAQYAALHAGEARGWSAFLEALASAGHEVWVRIRAGDAASLGRWLLSRAWPVVALFALMALLRLRRRRGPRASRAGRTAPVLPADVRALLTGVDAAFAHHGSPRPPSRGLLEHIEALPPGALAPETGATLRQAAAFVYARTFGGAPADTAAAQELQRRLG